MAGGNFTFGDIDDGLVVEVTTSGDSDAVQMKGEVDLASRPILDSALAVLAAPRLSVDLREVSFLDSTGLHALIAARNRCVDEGGGVRLIVTPHSPVSRLLDLAGVDGAFIIDESPPG